MWHFSRCRKVKCKFFFTCFFWYVSEKCFFVCVRVQHWPKNSQLVRTSGVAVLWQWNTIKVINFLFYSKLGSMLSVINGLLLRKKKISNKKIADINIVWFIVLRCLFTNEFHRKIEILQTNLTNVFFCSLLFRGRCRHSKRKFHHKRTTKTNIHFLKQSHTDTHIVCITKIKRIKQRRLILFNKTRK